MDWAILEVITVAVLAGLALGMHQGIRHFGQGYVAEIFEVTPRVGRSFIVLADFAYYLIFAAYILFSSNFERPAQYDDAGNLVRYRWSETVGAAQLQDSVFSIAGICLIIGILHGINVFVLPFVGSVLALRTRLLQPRGE